MLTEENELLCRVGPGTMMGNLLRRYWVPGCLSREIESDGEPLRVRLLGENLVAFRDTNGRAGFVDEYCAHRGASLFFGRNEECGLRCIYHGWKFDVDGNCVDMPSERQSFADRVHLPAYETHESGGIVWLYMGPPEHKPAFRDFGTESLPEDQVRAAKSMSTCSWLQSLEGNIDTAHVSWLHMFNAVKDIPDDGTDKPGYPSYATAWKIWGFDGAPKIEVQDEWYGYRYAGLRRTPHGHTHLRLTAYIFPFSTIIPYIPFSTGELFTVPIDDENCMRFNFNTQPAAIPRDIGGMGSASLLDVAPAYLRGFQRQQGLRKRPYNLENNYQISRDLQRTELFSGIPDFVSQDMAVTESMGPIYDRRKENLGTTDLAILRTRALLLEAAQDVADGKPAPALDGDFRSIRGAEKILEADEDWRHVGTNDDPIVQEALLALESGGARRVDQSWRTD